jgi:heme oxygenase
MRNVPVCYTRAIACTRERRQNVERCHGERSRTREVVEVRGISVALPGVVSDASTLRKALKNGTQPLHDQLEAGLALLEPELTIERYQRVLRAFHGFYAPVEAGLVRLTAGAPPLGFPLRVRSLLIERDLVALGLTHREIAELPRCADIPPLACPEDLAGCLYVFEGACLGGQVIARMLRRRFGLATNSGIAFFVGDAEATSDRWRRVLAWLDGIVRDGARSEAIVASASATFETLARWLEQQGAARWST